MPGKNVISQFAIEEEAKQILNFLTSHPHGKCSAVKEVVRDIMLRTDGTIILANGEYDIKARLLGGGVYRLTLVKF